MLLQGGMLREDVDFLSKDRGKYLIMPNGVQDIFSMNYVDGYSVGPHSILGLMKLDRSRWEVEETARWAFGRETFVAKGAVRYILPVEYETFFEVYGGQHLEDFDPDPVMPLSQSLMASGIFGWNDYKLYESTSAGVRLAMPLLFDLKMSAKVGWERRRPVVNSRKSNFFGAHAESNDPRVRVPHKASEIKLYDGPIAAELAKASLRFDYLHRRSLLVIDDMTVRETSDYPLLSLLLDMGIGKNREADRFRFLSIDMRASQTMTLPRYDDQLRYMGSAGLMLRHGTIGLADMHHFDASSFWWQRENEISRFALLDNYELSTSDCWTEAHAEWNSQQLLFTRLMTPREGLREFVQMHSVAVPHHRLHWEVQYGWDLLNMLRLGVSLGFNDQVYRGAAFTMILNLNAAQKK